MAKAARCIRPRMQPPQWATIEGVASVKRASSPRKRSSMTWETRVGPKEVALSRTSRPSHCRTTVPRKITLRLSLLIAHLAICKLRARGLDTQSILRHSLLGTGSTARLLGGSSSSRGYKLILHMSTEKGKFGIKRVLARKIKPALKKGLNLKASSRSFLRGM